MPSTASGIRTLDMLWLTIGKEALSSVVPIHARRWSDNTPLRGTTNDCSGYTCLSLRLCARAHAGACPSFGSRRMAAALRRPVKGLRLCRRALWSRSLVRVRALDRATRRHRISYRMSVRKDWCSVLVLTCVGGSEVAVGCRIGRLGEL
jgi:hypothetical protein